ncbi:MAG: helix-turn-helix domain-containing protein [Rhodopila sp.]
MMGTATPAFTSSGMFVIQNFCQWLGLCRTHVYVLIKRGELRPVKCGRRTLISTEEMLRWRAPLPEFQASGSSGERERQSI